MNTDIAALFAESGGKPVEWQGGVIHRSFDIALKRGCSLEISCLRHTASPVQGLAISSPERKFEMQCSGAIGRHFVFWTDTAPKHISVDVHRPVRSTALVQLRNVWRDAKYGLDFPRFDGHGVYAALGLRAS
jgi:hypothetical protein